MNPKLQNFKNELAAELKNILGWWINHAVDEEHGGFIGRIDQLNHQHTTADKGSVLNSRILWAFSAAYRNTKDPAYLTYATRAYHYFSEHFIDQLWGGVYWSVGYKGNPADKKKQVYAQAFGIYALSEFFLATGESTARQQAIDLFHLIEQHSYDELKGGYIDAFTQDWKTMDDIRLSGKDANEKKTMNTHLHILEAYTSLYRVWPEKIVAQKIKNLLQYFNEYIIDGKTDHLILFFDEDWCPKSTIVSYGHDIEASWLLQEAAEVTGDEQLVEHTKQTAIAIANAARQGIDTDGGLWYEYDPARDLLVKEKHWWPQAEAMVGFFNAWQLTGQQAFFDAAINSWHFIRRYIIDREGGEWVWGITADHYIMDRQDKAGIWKCPYHNSRACLEIIKRIDKLELVR
jgi:mannobiose 2-epimerase